MTRGHAPDAVPLPDPRDAHPVAFLPAAPGTWNLDLQVADSRLLVVDAVDLFAVPAFADESASYGQSVGQVLAEHPPPELAAGDVGPHVLQYDPP